MQSNMEEGTAVVVNYLGGHQGNVCQDPYVKMFALFGSRAPLYPHFVRATYTKHFCDHFCDQSRHLPLTTASLCLPISYFLLSPTRTFVSCVLRLVSLHPKHTV